MKKRCSRLIAVVLAALFLVAMLPTNVMASSEIVGDGKMGDNVYWTLTADGVLTVSGTGATWDYKDPWSTGVFEEKVPGMWNDWKYVWVVDPFGNERLECPRVIIINEGITTIGDCVFADMRQLTEVHIPVTVMSVKYCAFWGNSAITDVYYSGSMKEWGDIRVDDPDRANSSLFNATLHFAPQTPSAWAKTEVNAAINAGLVPTNLQQDYQTSVSRGEVATMFVNLLEQSSGKDIAIIMAEKNVTPKAWAFTDTSDNAVLAANALGIINGTGNGKFSPDGTLTRAQIAAIINRVANVMGVDTDGYKHSFTDVAGHWVSAELGWPFATGIINGVGNNKFDPDAELTAEQAIAITYRALNVLKG